VIDDMQKYALSILSHHFFMLWPNPYLD